MAHQISILLTILFLFSLSPVSAKPRLLPPPETARDNYGKPLQEGEIANVQAADLKGDGVADIGIVSYGGDNGAHSSFNIWKWNGKEFVRRFRKSADEMLGTTPGETSFVGLAAGDFAGDGKHEFLLQTDGGELLCVSWSGSDYQIKWRTKITHSLGLLEQVIDLHGDGHSDVVLGNDPKSKRYVYALQGSQFKQVWETPKPRVGTPGIVVAGRLRGNATQIVVTDGTMDSVLWQLYSSPAHLDRPIAEKLWNVNQTDCYYGARMAGRLQRNGQADIIALASTKRVKNKLFRQFWTVWQWAANGLKLLGQGPVWQSKNDASGTVLLTSDLGDLDGDGNDEIVNALVAGNVSQRTGIISILKWDGQKLVETRRYQADHPHISTFVIEAIADVKGNGQKELIAVGDGKLLLFRTRLPARKHVRLVN